MLSRNELQAIMNDLGSTAKERAVAQLRLDALPEEQEPPTFSPEALEMLRTFGRSHLREVTESDWSRYVTQRGITSCEALSAEYWQWNLPDQDFLELISGKQGLEAQLEHWKAVLQATTDRHVRANAASQIKLLENQSNERERL
jgi:hypothetical protein